MAAQKEEDFSAWYQELVFKADLIDEYPVSGCWVLKPWAFAIWAKVQEFCDARFKKLGVENCYFPMFIPEATLVKEKDHIEGFAPEVAWVTRAGSSELAEPIAIRPTSETVIYPSFAKWCRSWRDLPLRLNQWCSVVRWEFSDPMPFIRSREFLWQEGHTAHATYESAEQEVYDILDVYAAVYQELMALPVTKGKKSEKEKFAGGDYTTTTEAFVPETGRAIQAATSHHLGQNFAKMFDISIQNKDDPNGEPQYVYQNSWGLSTRSIGTLIMIHGDSNGLRLPPAISPIQVVIVPIFSKKIDAEELCGITSQLEADLEAVGVRAKADNSDHYTSGWKYNHYELKGVPLRIEIGARDVEGGVVMCARRDTGEKFSVSAATIVEEIGGILDNIQATMFQQAKDKVDASRAQVDTWPEFMAAIGEKKFCQVPWCERVECELDIKARSAEEAQAAMAEDESATGLSGAAKSLCIPLEIENDFSCEGKTCFACELPATAVANFGRSY